MKRFIKSYRCYPISSIGKPELENGDKIILPTSALTSLSSKDIKYPMLFQLKNKNNKRKVTHCGVMEFTAEQGTVLMPSWIMYNMKLREADSVEIKNVSLKTATFVKLRPHERAFLELSNPKAVFERILRGFSCLTSGDTIVIGYNDKKYSIDVLQTMPDTKAVSIIEADVEVDFAPAKDHKAPEKPAMAVSVEEAETEMVEEKRMEEEQEASFQDFNGKCYKLRDSY